ncbi:glycosyl transferase family 2 [Diplonema papillatum]|nr:glycosyl transferase family 2 [Diplonema papillatum]
MLRYYAKKYRAGWWTVLGGVVGALCLLDLSAGHGPLRVPRTGAVATEERAVPAHGLSDLRTGDRVRVTRDRSLIRELAGDRRLVWSTERYRGLAGQKGVVAKVSWSDDTYEVVLGERVLWLPGPLLEKVEAFALKPHRLDSSEEKYSRARPDSGDSTARRNRGSNGDDSPDTDNSNNDNKAQSSRGFDGTEGGEPPAGAHARHSGRRLGNLPLPRDAKRELRFSRVSLRDACGGSLQGADKEPAACFLAARVGPVWLTGAAGRGDGWRVFEVRRTVKASRTWLAFRSASGLYLAAGLDGTTSVDRAAAKSFENFAVVDETSEGVLLYSKCAPPVCPKVTERWLAYDEDSGLVTAADNRNQAVRVRFYAADGGCGAWCDAAARKRLADRPVGRGWAHVDRGCAVALFTTVKPVGLRGPADKQVSARVYANWKQLGGGVAQYVFSEDAATRSEAKRAGLRADGEVELLPGFPAPTYRSLFARAETLSADAGGLLMYANGDILFTRSLAATVCAVQKWMAAAGNQRFLIVGRRFNHDFDPDEDEVTGDDGPDMWDAGVEAMKGEQWQEDAIDYFVVSRGLFKWLDLPPMVVGGTAFDNWFLQKALTSPGVTVFDATRTVTAVHLSSSASSLFESHRSTQSKHNMKLGEKEGGWAKGKVTLAPYITAFFNESVIICQRGVANERA